MVSILSWPQCVNIQDQNLVIIVAADGPAPDSGGPSADAMLKTKLGLYFSKIHLALTLKHRETHGCVVSTVANDALVLKHQAISIHNAD